MSDSTQRSSDDIGLSQFDLRAMFAFVTAVAAVTRLAVSQFAGWTMVVIAFLLGALNCAGRLRNMQSPSARPRLFRLGWALLAFSLFLPAARGCGEARIEGWRAAGVCGAMVVDSLKKGEWYAAGFFGWLSFGNLLLLASPLLLWRLRLGAGRVYNVLLATVIAAMCSLSIRGTHQFLIGYYLWCCAGLSFLCAARMRWPTLLLMAGVVCSLLVLQE